MSDPHALAATSGITGTHPNAETKQAQPPCPDWCTTFCAGVDHGGEPDSDAWPSIRPAAQHGPAAWRIAFAPASGNNIPDIIMQIDDDGRGTGGIDLSAYLTLDEALLLAYRVIDARWTAMRDLGEPSGITCEDDGGCDGPIEDNEEAIHRQLAKIVEVRGLLEDAAPDLPVPPSEWQCPAWCQDAGTQHAGLDDYDDADEPIWSWVHRPAETFGPLEVYAYEYSNAPGALTFHASLIETSPASIDITEYDVTDVRQIANHYSDAAAWIEAQS